MNKHDKLTVAARDMAGQENCDGPEYDMIIELTDLLQLYGDALNRIKFDFYQLKANLKTLSELNINQARTIENLQAQVKELQDKIDYENCDLST